MDKQKKVSTKQLRTTDIDIIAGARQTDQLDRLKENARGSELLKFTRNYKKLSIILIISFCVMYVVMFLNIESSDHIYFSLNRVYMSLLMVCPMAILMLIMMSEMYTNRIINNFVIVLSSCVFLLSLTCLRTQFSIGDRQYMKAMIPHHSSAIMTSKNASIEDPRVRSLADSIIKSQQHEIARMKQLLTTIDQ